MNNVNIELFRDEEKKELRAGEMIFYSHFILAQFAVGVVVVAREK